MTSSNDNKISFPQQEQIHIRLQKKGKQEQDQCQINQLNDAYMSMLKDKQTKANQKQSSQQLKNNYEIKPNQQKIPLPQNQQKLQPNQEFQQFSVQQAPQFQPFQYGCNPYHQYPGGREHRGGHHGWGRGHHSHWQQPPPPPYIQGFGQGQNPQFRPISNGYGGFGGGFGNYQAPPPGWGGNDYGDKKRWRGMGKCGGWERGEKNERRRHRGGRSASRSSSRSSSSSSQGSRFSSNSNQNQPVNQFQQQFLQYQANVRVYYEKQMTGFFQSRAVNELQRQKIINRLIQKFPQGDFNPRQLIKCLQQAEEMKLVFKMSYFRIVKEILKFNFDMYEAAPRLSVIQQKKIRKFEADNEYKQKYGDVDMPVLFDVDELINLDLTKTVFLVDGNNIFPTNKHFRRYFQSFLLSEKIEAQLRLQWLLSHALQPQGTILFFDEKYDEDTFQMTKHYIIPDQELNRLKNIEVVYGINTKADNKIIARLEQIKKQNIGKKIVLVSADRDLYMRCLGVTEAEHTSGKYFFKFCKYRMFRQYKGIKDKKTLAKTIMKYHNR